MRKGQRKSAQGNRAGEKPASPPGPDAHFRAVQMPRMPGSWVQPSVNNPSTLPSEPAVPTPTSLLKLSQRNAKKPCRRPSPEEAPRRGPVGFLRKTSHTWRA